MKHAARGAPLDILLADRAASGVPIHVGLIGAGAAGRGIALSLVDGVPGLRLAAIASRSAASARRAFAEAGVLDPVDATDPAQVDRAIESGGYAVVQDAKALCHSAMLDVVIEATGTFEYAAQVVTQALQCRKHVILVNAELDATIGPLLAHRAREDGVVLTGIDGDEPGVAMTLLRYLRSVGFQPVAAGNLKGLVDHTRTPDRQLAFAQRHRLDPRKAAAFADGTKLAMEATVLANASGFRVGTRGMFGPRCTHVRELAHLLPADALLAGGLVDYALGAAPHSGAFVIVYEPRHARRQLLEYCKMGEGPFHVFYTPYHVPHVQLASTVARAVLQADPTVVAAGGPVCETVSVAKRPLRPGEVLDGAGGFLTYGVIDNAPDAAALDALPMGISEGCRMIRPVQQNALITYADVEVPPGRLIDQLRAEQARLFAEYRVHSTGVRENA